MTSEAIHIRVGAILLSELEPDLKERAIDTTSVMGTSFTVDTISDIASLAAVMVCRRIIRICSCGNILSTCFLLAKVIPVLLRGVEATFSAGGVQTVTSSGLCGTASFPLSVGANLHIESQLTEIVLLVRVNMS